MSVNSDRIERIQLEAARIVTGLTAYASTESIFTETGWESLKCRREQRKLVLFYKIVNGDCPEYLTDLLPPLVSDITPYNLRSGQNYIIPQANLTIYQQSFFPATLKLWNSLDPTIRQSTSAETFKLKLKLQYRRQSKPPPYYFIGDRFLSIIHTRLRNKCSSLKYDLYRSNIITEKSCNCGALNETVEHYLLYCENYRAYRNKLYEDISNLHVPVTLNTLLYGNLDENYDTNCAIFNYVQQFIKSTERFTER